MIIYIKNIFKIFIIILLLIFCSVLPSRALEVETHKTVNKYIANKNTNINGFSLHQYLQKQLGMQKGSEEFVNDKMIFDWIGDGGVEEDAGFRALNHFLNPLTDEGILGYFSALQWATLPVATQSFSPFASWNDVRNYYFKALTSTDSATREGWFAMTFQGVGQLMHLEQDMSVPAHVRDDKHLKLFGLGGDGYENWMDKSENRDVIANFAAISFAHDTSFSLNIKNLFDTDRYNGTNPDITTSSNIIGLAEYTNANFFSGDTINAANFPYPKTDSNKKAIMPYTGPEATYNREYFRKDCSEVYCQASASKNYSGYLLSAVDLNDYWRMQNPNSSDSLPVIPVLDENVYYDYSQFLIPRAIGYSSQLLNYFFRGEIEAKLLPVFDESKLESVRIKVRNITPSKDSMGGNSDSMFFLAYRYTPPGAPADGSQDIWSKVPYVYPLPNILPYGKDSDGNDLKDAETEILFGGFPVDIPISNYQNTKFILTYRGNLGEEKINLANNELGGVIGKFGAAKPITFHEEWNTSPKGDFNWFQMDSTVFGSNICPYHSIDHGVAQNNIINGKLIKTNIRYPIILAPGETKKDGEGMHLNTSLIGVSNPSGATYANNIFPIPITKDTYIEFKIDDMTISPNTAESGNYTHYQGLVLSFNNGYRLELSMNGHFWYLNDTTGYFSFNAGHIIFDNIYELFQQCNLPIPNDFKLNYIALFQRIGFNLPIDVQYEQKMIVDFIRIVEMDKMAPEQ